VTRHWATWYATDIPVDSSEQPLRILIVDGDAFFRRGVREIVNEAAGMHVVGEAADGEQAVQLARELGAHQLDLVLIDVDLPRLDGIAAAQQLIRNDPSLAVAMLTLSTLDQDLVNSVRSGAIGFLSKNLAPDALVRALHGFQRGESLPMSRAMGQKLLGMVRQSGTPPRSMVAPPTPNLTPREKEVLELVAHGARDREIAQQFVISESTVKKHVQNILRKLQARNRAEAVARLRDGSARAAQ
jgi:two-component system, NarL family, nitrate/nitrite response regulator NarL